MLPLSLRHIPYVAKVKIEKHQIIISPYQASDLIFVLSYLKLHSLSKCSSLIDITCVDYPSRKNRFELVYIIQSLQENTKVIIKIKVNEIEPVASVCEIFSGACWAEREIWDMFGVFFKNNPDLRRILTDYGFSGYPLRKEFPLSGYVEVFYNHKQKRVLTKRVEMTQEFRSFDLTTPWK